jgi:hypothetical protein
MKLLKNKLAFFFILISTSNSLSAAVEDSGLSQTTPTFTKEVPPSIEQYLLIDSIISYLRKELKHSKNPIERKNRKETLDRFDKELSEGICLALSVLWSYGKRIEDDNNNVPKTGTDDATWFNNTYHSLLKESQFSWKFWKKKKSLSSEEKENIEKFISTLILLQDTQAARLLGTQKGNLPTLVQDVSKGSLHFEYAYSLSGFKLELLEKRLEKIINPKKINILNLGGFGGLEKGIHALAIYQNSHTQKFYCYNPDSKTGEKTFTTISEVALWLQEEYKELEQHGFKFYDPTHPHTLSQITIGVFDFITPDTPPSLIPAPQALEIDRHEFFNTIQSYGSLKLPLPLWYHDYVEREFPDVTNYPIIADWYGEQLNEAVKRGQYEHVRMLIKQGANLLKVDLSQITDPEMLVLFPETLLPEEAKKALQKATEALSPASHYFESLV